MAQTKKYTVIDNIVDDAPFQNINWCTMSFLTPQKVDKTKYMDIRGFKIHNGFNTPDMADSDAKAMQARQPNHDVYIAGIGKLYGWDDATKADNIQYSDKKLNDLEKSRRENVDKIKLMCEQYKNETNMGITLNDADKRKEKIENRLRKKMLDEGIISQTEYNLLKDDSRPANSTKKEIEARELMNREINLCTDDYLDENLPCAFKFGCVTFFSPTHIKGLTTFCFKIRGLFEDEQSLRLRVDELKRKYPHDRIHIFEVGKWTPYTDANQFDGNKLLSELNYAMKCHNENMEKEKDEFDARKNELQKRNEQQASTTKKLTNAQKKREKRAKKAEQAQAPGTVTTTSAVPELMPEESNVSTVDESAPIIGNEIDADRIKMIFNYLNDDDLKNKFVMDDSTLSKQERVQVI